MKKSGFILWEGPSKIDGAPIVVIATLKSNNVKTGNMIQTWIIRKDINPVEASQSKLDASICGQCPHRQSLGGGCYVNLGQAPLAVYKAYKRGLYAPIQTDDYGLYFKGRAIRFGSYGDPYLIPLHIIKALAGMAKKYTGYTHQWKRYDAMEYSAFLMASVDSESESVMARANNWRYFRVTKAIKPAPGEIECLSESKGLTCEACGLCKGFNLLPSIVILGHGSRQNNLRVE